MGTDSRPDKISVPHSQAAGQRGMESLWFWLLFPFYIFLFPVLLRFLPMQAHHPLLDRVREEVVPMFRVYG